MFQLKINASSRGQAVVLIAAVMVIVLGFTALAIDGGIVYLAQRNAQNAADAAVLGATYALCSGGNVTSEALAAAAINGFNNDGTTNTVTINNPPASGTFVGHTDYVEVTVWVDAPTHLIQLVYPGPTEVSVRAMGQCRPPMVAWSGYAVVSISTASNAVGITSVGGGNIELVGGGAFSNSTVSNASGSIAAGGGGNLSTDGACIDAAGSIVYGGGSTISPICNTFLPPQQDPMATLDEPDSPGGCVNVPNINGDNVVLPPGCYNGIKMNNGSLTFSGGGVYYMMGDIEINDGDFIATDSMIFFADGGFSTTGGSFTLTAPTSGEWQGMAMFSSRANTSSSEAIKFTATGATDLVGTVYAPGVDVTLSGQTGDHVVGQIIANTVHVSGQSDFEIIYDEDYFYHMPPSLALNE